MKLKTLVLSAILPVLAVLMLSQIVLVNNKSSVAFATGPITTPITAPLTKLLSGNVTYRFLNTPSGTPWIIVAKNVKVEATNKATNQKFSTTSNGQGHYELNLEQGDYVVKATDLNYSNFVPSNVNVNMSENKTIEFQNSNWLKYSYPTLRTLFGKVQGQPGYKAQYDIDNNKVINTGDYSILRPVLFN